MERIIWIAFVNRTDDTDPHCGVYATKQAAIDGIKMELAHLTARERATVTDCYVEKRRIVFSEDGDEVDECRTYDSYILEQVVVNL